MPECKRGTFYCIKCYVFHMASIKYHKSFTKLGAFAVGLLTPTFCLDSGVDTSKIL